MHAIDTFEHWGIPVEIHQDYDAGDPYENFDQASRLVWCSSVSRREAFRDVETVDDESWDVAVVHRYLTLFGGESVAIPFRYHDYGSGGYDVYLQDAPNERTAGFLCVSRETLEKEWVPYVTEPAAAPQKAEDCARAEFATWKAWLQGDVYGYVVADGTPEQESCWGFYGPGDEYVRQEARSMAEHAAFEQEKRRLTERMYLLDPEANPAELSREAFAARFEGVPA